MAADLDDLRSRSDALGDRLEDDGALEVNAEILALAPGDAKATLRLGAGLMARGRVKDALEVYEKGAEANPRNTMIAGRVKQARNAVGLADKAPPRAAAGKRGVRSSGVTGWLKAMYHEDGWTVEPGQTTWISDPGQIDAGGERMIRADGVPWGEPSWSIGDPVGLYFSGTKKVPLLVRVAERPRFDPAFVEQETGSAEDAQRWPWVTPVKGIAALPLDKAPTLEQLGIAHARMQQRARLVLDGEERKRLLSLLGG
jgi:tetratricopeptide (TPR) repeat protein